MKDFFIVTESDLWVYASSIKELTIDHFHYSQCFGSAYIFNELTKVIYKGNLGMTILCEHGIIINKIIYHYNYERNKIYLLHNFL